MSLNCHYATKFGAKHVCSTNIFPIEFGKRAKILQKKTLRIFWENINEAVLFCYGTSSLLQRIYDYFLKDNWDYILEKSPSSESWQHREIRPSLTFCITILKSA